MSKSVYAKISAVSGSIHKVEKNAKNSFHNYMYQSWDAVLVALKSACNQHGLVILQEPVDEKLMPVTSSKGNEKVSLVVSYRFVIADADTGESITVHNIGQAILEDDKAYNKCQTAAYKYMALKVFQIAVSGDDSDTDSGSGVGSAPKSGNNGQQAQTGGIPAGSWKAFEKQCKARAVDILAFNEIVKERGLSDPKQIAALFNETYPEGQSA